MDEAIREFITTNPAQEKRIWSLSLNAHGPLSHFTLWTADEQAVNCFHVNFMVGKTVVDQREAFRDTCQWLRDNLKIETTFNLHDGEAFDVSLPFSLPLHHMTFIVMWYFCNSTLTRYVTGRNHVLWMGRAFKKALKAGAPELSAAIEAYPTLTAVRNKGKKAAETYLLNLGLYDSAAFDGVLAEIKKLLPEGGRDAITVYSGVDIPTGPSQSVHVSGMKQAVADLFVLLRFLYNRKPQVPTVDAETGAEIPSGFPNGDFRKTSCTYLIEVNI